MGLIFGFVLAAICFYLAYERRPWWYVLIGCAALMVLSIPMMRGVALQAAIVSFLVKCLWGFAGFGLGTLALRNKGAPSDPAVKRNDAPADDMW